MALKTPSEFRPYRRLFQGVFAFVAIGGVIFLLISIGLSVFGRRDAGPLPAQISGQPSVDEQVACQREVQGLFDELNQQLFERQKDVSKSDVDVLSKWEAWRERWHRRWTEVGYRCRFEGSKGKGLGDAYDRMAYVHEDLEEIEQRFDAQLNRFLNHEAPHVAEIRAALAENDRLLRKLSNRGQ